MCPNQHKGLVLPQETGLDDEAYQPGGGASVSQSEIEDLLYADDRPLGERLDRLREIRDEVRVRASMDFAGDDQRRLCVELDEAIGQLALRHGLSAAFDHDPRDHREALAPDSDELAELRDEDEATGWDEAPGTRPQAPGGTR